MDYLLKLRNNETNKLEFFSLFIAISKINDYDLIKKTMLKNPNGTAFYIIANAAAILDNNTFEEEFYLVEGAKKNNIKAIERLVQIYKYSNDEILVEKYTKLLNKIKTNQVNKKSIVENRVKVLKSFGGRL